MGRVFVMAVIVVSSCGFFMALMGYIRHNLNQAKVSVVAKGDNIQVGDMEIHINAAFQYGTDRSNPLIQTIYLNGWIRHGTDTKFKCCLANKDGITEVDAVLYHEYSQWVVDMQGAEFRCGEPNNGKVVAMSTTRFDYVTFAQSSCSQIPAQVMEIEHPQRQTGSLGVCLKISYGNLSAIRVVEWFEYQKLMNVTSVFTYYHGIDPYVLGIFNHYRDTGLLTILPLHPAVKKGGKERWFTKPRYEKQAWVDEVMAANDCKHRMSGFDYVIVMDIDEFIVPKPPHTTIHSVLEATSNIHAKPSAAAFSIDAYVVVLDWGVTRKAPLFTTSYVSRINWANYDGAAQQARWAFSPLNVFYVQNNRAWPRQGYMAAKVPNDLFVLLHFRSCKPWWKGCPTLKRRQTDTSLVTYEAKLVQSILSLPSQLLHKDMDYVTGLKKWSNVTS